MPDISIPQGKLPRICSRRSIKLPSKTGLVQKIRTNGARRLSSKKPESSSPSAWESGERQDQRAVHTAASFMAPVILSPRAQLDPTPVSEQQEN
ncbi:hypothetical protein NEUTE1DRAFT_137851 [Neurospora tetrasperma FGSC 2508]|uniref:Uncharacterized protein n=1 Tax=Neurospora tetrasperma (strain FGSC 2508 / ATCC MYA-4615 / P0657) TaxID=510951 RepID=F8MNC7_NEUT8|nr:uncharacterized protein NEUTE1DRAFT_137851 [Neurospora tetrasperma FGSC 2508]EGO58097.1 hypothetical protein NEUTE1DRAFT_137851 [Neurospora tetrasperma FGSC 2508]